MSEQLDTATPDTTTEAHGVLLTDVAADKVRSLLEQEGRDDLRLRVGVQPGGCSGLIYQLYFDERPLPRRCVHRLLGHDREAGLHHRQPERRQQLRLRRQLQLSPRHTKEGSLTPRG